MIALYDKATKKPVRVTTVKEFLDTHPTVCVKDLPYVGSSKAIEVVEDNGRTVLGFVRDTPSVTSWVQLYQLFTLWMYNGLNACGPLYRLHK